MRQNKLNFLIKCLALFFLEASIRNVAAEGIDIFSAASTGDLDTLKNFIQTKKIDVNAQNKHGKTALHYASLHGHLPIVNYLVSKCKARVNIEDKCGRTALHLASGHGHLDVVKFLLGGNYVTRMLNKLLRLCGQDMQNIDVDVCDNDDCTALHYASKFGYLSVVKYLVSTCGANVDLKDNAGDTPLHLASYFDRLDMVIFLVEKGKADLFIKNNDQNQPYDLAFSEDYTELANYLLYRMAIY